VTDGAGAREPGGVSPAARIARRDRERHRRGEARPVGRTLEHTMVRIKRAYEPSARGDGYRVLIDRLWPRGLSKDALPLDAWTRELSPSDALRRWFGHEPSRWRGFVARYRRELRAPAARAAVDQLARRAAAGTVTLVYGARDEAHNDAVVVRGEIERRLRPRARRSVRARRRTAG
jgi:uncharacterized protein YeaO (DUF488 family)